MNTLQFFTVPFVTHLNSIAVIEVKAIDMAAARAYVQRTQINFKEHWYD